LARRIDTVTIPLSREKIELPWESQQALLSQFSHLDSLRSLREAFQAVGTSRPVELTREQKGHLLQVIEHWAIAGGFAELPVGIYELRNALIDDLHDASDAS
jgi:hypothetical protein